MQIINETLYLVNQTQYLVYIMMVYDFLCSSCKQFSRVGAISCLVQIYTVPEVKTPVTTLSPAYNNCNSPKVRGQSYQSTQLSSSSDSKKPPLF